MNGSKVGAIMLVILFTLLSGVGDSQGFLHSAKLWVNGRAVWPEVARSSLGYGFGILMYWLALRFLAQVGNVPVEVQTLGWFVVTIVGVALLSGSFLRWQTVDRAVGVVLLAGVGWLLVRTGS